MESEPPFFGQLWTPDQRSSKIIFICVHSEKKISMYNQPQPFDVRTWLGDFGTRWNIKRIKKGWLFSTFKITFMELNAEIKYKTDNKFGDALYKYTSHG